MFLSYGEVSIIVMLLLTIIWTMSLSKDIKCMMDTGTYVPWVLPPIPSMGMLAMEYSILLAVAIVISLFWAVFIAGVLIATLCYVYHVVRVIFR